MAGLEEDVDLDAETRRYVLDVYANHERISHYELLGVPRDADKKAIKRAYFRLAATLHPDRYFGKKLGSFKAKMELLFRKISDAHELLLSPDKRARYDATLGAAVASTPIEDPRAAAQRKADEEARAQALAKAKPHIDAAERAKSAGDFAAALTAYRLARAILPEDKDLERAQLEVQRAFAERASESFVRQALIEEKHGHWAQAVTSWKRAAAARPHDESVRARLANALAKARSA
ncbi:MAG: DnaJ domain-containing protein [Polyangiales bacterium]